MDVRDTGEAGGGHQGKRSRQPRVRGELDGRSRAWAGGPGFRLWCRELFPGLQWVGVRAAHGGWEGSGRSPGGDVQPRPREASCGRRLPACQEAPWVGGLVACPARG